MSSMYDDDDDSDDSDDSVTGDEPLSSDARAVGWRDVHSVATDRMRALRRRNPALAGRLRDVLAGKIFADDKERHNTARDLMMWLANQVPSATAEAIVALFGPSLVQMRREQDDVDDDAEFLRLARGALDKVQARQAEHEARRERARDARITAAFGFERNEPYTDDELDAIAAADGTDREGLRTRWIVRFNKLVYFRAPHGLRGPYPVEAAVDVARELLAPAASAGVTLMEPGEKGWQPVPLAQLMERYGSMADKVRFDLTAQRARFDPLNRAVIEAPMPLRDLVPAFDADVDAWLRLFAGSKYERVLDLLATVTDLSRPTAALVLIGATDAGKSMFAHALARLWCETDATPLKHLFADFNDAVLRCPVVLGDEKVPSDFRGHERTEELREVIAARTHTISRKHRDSATATGALRVILTANNRRILSFADDLTDDDIEALSERFLVVEVPEAARDFLKGLGNAETFVTADRLARHALYLRDTRTVTTGGRFLVRGDADGLVQEILCSSGLRPRIHEFIVGCLTTRRHTQAPDGHPGPMAVRVRDGRVLVHTPSMCQRWKAFFDTATTPEQSRLTDAASGLFEKSDVRAEVVVNGARVAYRVVKFDLLMTYAVRAGMTPDEFLAAVAACDETARRRAPGNPPPPPRST